MKLCSAVSCLIENGAENNKKRIALFLDDLNVLYRMKLARAFAGIPLTQTKNIVFY